MNYRKNTRSEQSSHVCDLILGVFIYKSTVALQYNTLWHLSIRKTGGESIFLPGNQRGYSKGRDGTTGTGTARWTSFSFLWGLYYKYQTAEERSSRHTILGSHTYLKRVHNGKTQDVSRSVMLTREYNRLISRGAEISLRIASKR